jgi:serine/threonine protein kinase
MSKEALNILNGMLIMDPNERLTAIDALAHSYFDPIREPEVDQLIFQHRQLQEQKRAQAEAAHNAESALNQYGHVGHTRADRRGESSKSRASVRS